MRVIEKRGSRREEGKRGEIDSPFPRKVLTAKGVKDYEE